MNAKWSRFFILSLFCVTFWACAKNPKEPGYHVEILSDMVEAVPAEAYSKNAVLPNAQVLQSAPAGTVALGQQLFLYDKTEEDSVRAGLELKNPYPKSSERLERGKWIYDNFCLACHGVTGEGDGQLIPKYPNPPAFLDKRLVSMPDGQMFHSITLGRKDMPAHRSQISAEDRWNVILYVRELQGQK